MIDSRKRFTSIAELYNSARPSYPDTLVRWIIKCSKLRSGGTIVDVGCGTGISTRLFLNQKFNLIGVDPNPDMLRVAKAATNTGAVYMEGEATNTGLASRSANLVISAQAFHWFELDSTIAEFGRILKPDGWCFAFWNVAANTPAMNAYKKLLRDSSTDYRNTPKASQTIAELTQRPQVRNTITQSFANSQVMNRTQLQARARSSSYVAHGLKYPDVFTTKLDGFFLRHQENDHITFRYTTISIGWQFI